MIRFKQYITEKSVKGMILKSYLENPTPREIVRFIKGTHYNSIRLMIDPSNNTLYVWDAFRMTHAEFDRKEIFRQGEVSKNGKNRANIDMWHNDEGTRIGTNKEYKKIIKDTMKLLEKEFKGNFVESDEEDQWDSDFVMYEWYPEGSSF